MFAASLSPMPPFRFPGMKLTGLRRNFARGIVLALALSALLHLLLILSPPWWTPALDDFHGEDAPRVEARLVRHAASHPAPRRGMRRASPPPVAAPAAADATGVPSASAASAPADTAGAETPPAGEPQPQPAPESESLPAAIPDVVFSLPRRGRIRFTVQGGDGFVMGQTTHEWRHDNQSYTLTGVTETTGLVALFRPVKIVQSSEGGFANGVLMPREFREERSDGRANTASFDWDKLQVTLNGQQVVSIAGGAEDFLSMFYQLTQAAQRGEGFEMAITTGRKVERYAFEWLDEEEVTVKAGRFRTWHVRVYAVSGARDVTEVWLGQDAAGLPVKIRQTDRKGGIVDLQAEEIDYEGK